MLFVHIFSKVPEFRIDQRVPGLQFGWISQLISHKKSARRARRGDDIYKILCFAAEFMSLGLLTYMRRTIRHISKFVLASKRKL